MKKMILAVLFGLFTQNLFAEVQVAGPVSFVAAGNLSVFPGLSATEQAVSIDTNAASYTDWNDPGFEFITQCGVYPVGAVAVIDIASDAGKQAMALAASANATRQQTMLLYHVDADSSWQSGFKCTVDAVIVMGG